MLSPPPPPSLWSTQASAEPSVRTGLFSSDKQRRGSLRSSTSDEEWLRDGTVEDYDYEDDYEDDLEEEEPRKEGDHVAQRVKFVPRLVTAVYRFESYRAEDLPLLFYSEREILLLQMEADGPIPDDDEDSGSPPISSQGRSSSSTSGRNTRIETIVFSDTDSDDGL